MLAAVLRGIGEPIHVEEREALVPNPGQSIVQVRYAAINHRDLWIQQGKYAGLRFPIVLGSDGMGTHAGHEVLIQPGLGWGNNESHQDRSYRILGLPNDGTFATEVMVPTENLLGIPKHLSAEEAAALPLAGLTAYRAVFVKANVTHSDRVLITGIGGGVATLAMQMCLAQGAEVYVTSGSPEKIKKAMDMGAAGGVLYQDADWHHRLKDRSDGIHKVIDGTAGSSLGQAIECLLPGGIAVNYGGTAGKIEITPQRLFWNQVTLMGTTMGSPADFKAMLAFVEKHHIRPVVAAVFDLEKINEAFTFIQDRSQFGKVVLSIPPV